MPVTSRSQARRTADSFKELPIVRSTNSSKELSNNITIDSSKELSTSDSTSSSKDLSNKASIINHLPPASCYDTIENTATTLMSIASPCHLDSLSSALFQNLEFENLEFSKQSYADVDCISVFTGPHNFEMEEDCKEDLSKLKLP
jgi:hypothetical protein